MSDKDVRQRCAIKIGDKDMPYIYYDTCNNDMQDRCEIKICNTDMQHRCAIDICNTCMMCYCFIDFDVKRNGAF